MDGDGNKVWEKCYGGDGADLLYDVQQTADDGYVLGGWSICGVSGNKTSPGYGTWDYWVVKVDSKGEKIWDQTFGGNDADYLWVIQQTADGGYILGGSSQSYPSGNKTSANYAGQFGSGGDYWILKLDGNGNKVWENSFGGDNNDAMFDLQQTQDGGFVLAGGSASGATGNKTIGRLGSYGTYDSWLLKINAGGNKVWDAGFGGNTSDLINGIAKTSTGYILGASSDSSPSGNKTTPSYGGSDFWIVKLEGPPIIATQPQDQVIAVGDPAVFSVVAKGAAPLVYHWLFNGNPIAGATNATLTLFDTTYAQAGFYSVIATNQFGSVTSRKAQLVFNFLTLGMYAGLRIDGTVGQSYRLEYTPAVGDQTNWQVLTNVTLTATRYLYIDLNSPRTQRFYRALLLP